ncbi:MAG: hypothetical protein HFJ84_04255 [Clostridiales bacterium]|jgi:hypothetical protein|nr:hypothetical protein [Clostridiales bacterium]
MKKYKAQMVTFVCVVLFTILVLLGIWIWSMNHVGLGPSPEVYNMNANYNLVIYD